MLGERVITIADLMNRHDYVPKMPNQTEQDLIFDTNFPDVQPYLFRVPNLFSISLFLRYLLFSDRGKFNICALRMV